jgi:hypothetical protein
MAIYDHIYESLGPYVEMIYRKSGLGSRVWRGGGHLPESEPKRVGLHLIVPQTIKPKP